MRLRYKKFILAFTMAVMLIGMGTFSMLTPTVSFSFGRDSAGKGTDTGSGTSAPLEEAEVEADITTLVKNYFDAKQRVDMTELAECVSDISHVDEKKLVTEAEYIEAYKNIECTIKQDGLSDGCYRVYAYCEIKVYDIDTLMPSLSSLYVTSDDTGGFTIWLGVTQDQEAIEALDASSEVQELMADVQEKLETLVSENEDVRDFYEMLESADTESDDSTDSGEDANAQATAEAEN